MTERQIRGALGEQAAVDYLRKRGFMLVERNYRLGQHEVDIIAQRDDELHFIEVKTRKVGSLTAPEEAINERKARTMRRVASAYLSIHDTPYEPRFSMVAIEVAGEDVIDIRFIEDIIEFGW